MIDIIIFENAEKWNKNQCNL